MTEQPPAFSSTPSALPETLPVLALPGVVLLPGARLPLNLIEPSHLAMAEEAMGTGRLIGIVQPSTGDAPALHPPLYKVGCAGRIISFSETDDGRFLLNILGVCRFSVVEETALPNGLLRVKPDWQKFLGDMRPREEGGFDRAHLMGVLRAYFKAQGIAADWNAVQNTTSDLLISSLIMICDLEPNEKQALLEAADLPARAKLLTALLEMACLRQDESEEVRH